MSKVVPPKYIVSTNYYFKVMKLKCGSAKGYSLEINIKYIFI
jgi:hypothetical protein